MRITKNVDFWILMRSEADISIGLFLHYTCNVLGVFYIQSILPVVLVSCEMLLNFNSFKRETIKKIYLWQLREDIQSRILIPLRETNKFGLYCAQINHTRSLKPNLGKQANTQVQFQSLHKV